VSTRERILTAAARLFSHQGYAATSLAQVARAAQVSKALVLWHFESKEHLFRAALQHFLAPYEIDAHALLGLNENEQVEKLIDDYYDFIAEHLPSVQFVLGQVVRQDENSQELVAHARELYRVYRELLMTILERGRAARVFTQHVRPTEDAALIMAALNGLLLQHLVEPEGTVTVRAKELLARLKSTTRAWLCSPLPREEVPAPLVANPRPHETPAQRAGS
jgi:AcrR family transcriptional regulator